MAVFQVAVLWYYTASYKQHEEEFKVKKAHYGSLSTMFCCAFAATFAYSGLAADVTFPNSDGSGDIASADAWGESGLPVSPDRPLFNYDKRDLTYTASDDVTFAGIGLASGTIVYTATFDMREAKSGSASRTITLRDSISNGVKKACANFYGGIWYVDGGLSQHSENTFTVGGGAIMTFTGDYKQGGGGTTLKVDGSGTSISFARSQFPRYSGGQHIIITNGASMVLTGGEPYSSASGSYVSIGALAMSADNGGAGSRSVSVSGSGSTLSITAYDTFAWVGGVFTGGGHSLTVSEGGLYNSPGATLYVSSKGDGNNIVTVCDTDSRMVVSNLVVGANNKEVGLLNCGDALRIQDGASVVAKANVTVQRGSTLAFGYPAGGFAANLVPLTAAGTLTVNSGCHVELSGIEERIAALEAGTTEIATLATAGTGMSIDVDAIAAANASLPEKCELYVDGLSLKLKLAKPSSGLMIFVR